MNTPGVEQPNQSAFDPRSMTSPFSRPAQPGFDRQTANFVVKPRSSEGIGPACSGRSPQRPMAMICVQEGSGFVTTVPCRRTSTWSSNIIAPCSSTRKPSSTTSPVRRFLFHVRCVTRHGLLKAWRLPEGSSGHPTRRATLLSRTSTSTTNALKSGRCAARFCCFIRDMCFKSGAVVLTGDFNKAVERETSSSDGERRTSQMEAGHKWSDCCRFMVLRESQSQWLILRHGSINVILADVGLTATDKTWHHEQWLHLKFAGLKRRRDVSPADSKSRQKIVL